MYYLLRDPLYTSLTGPVAGRVLETLGRIPLLGMLFRYALAMLQYIQRHHFYIAASS